MLKKMMTIKEKWGWELVGEQLELNEKQEAGQPKPMKQCTNAMILYTGRREAAILDA